MFHRMFQYLLAEGGQYSTTHIMIIISNDNPMILETSFIEFSIKKVPMNMLII